MLIRPGRELQRREHLQGNIEMRAWEEDYELRSAGEVRV